MRIPKKAYRATFALILCLVMTLSSFNVYGVTPPGSSDQGDGTYMNPVIWADVPDTDIIRVGDTYWMASTTMHMSPGVPIMKSYDLVNWETVSYCYNTLGDSDILKLQTGRNSYSQGSWASTLRYKNGTFYLIVPSLVSGNTWRAQIFQTEDPEKQAWRRYELPGRYHDCGLLLDDDGKNWLVYDGGNASASIIELNSDVTGLAEGATPRTLVANKFAPHPTTGEMPASGTLAEGAHIRKIGGYYYLIVITGGGYPSGSSPSGWMRTAIAHRAPSLTTPADEWESKVIGLESVNGSGVAQGDIVYTGTGDPNVDLEGWYGLFFRDSDAGGRMPWLMPVTWVDGWPMLGEGGSHAPYARSGGIPINLADGNEKKSVVASDEFYNNAPRPLYYETPVTPISATPQETTGTADVMQSNDIMELSDENIALNKPARASRVENSDAGRQPAAAFDGIIQVPNGDNRWGNPGGTSDNWIEVDLGEEYDLESINIFWFNSNDPPRVHYYNVWVKSEEIAEFVPDDVVNSGKTTAQFQNEGYTRVVNKINNTVGVETTDDLSGTKARYVAVHVTGQSAGSAASIREIEIYGSMGMPGVPEILSAERDDGEVTLTWTIPSPGGSPITDMQVSIDDGEWIDLPDDATTYTFSDLVNGEWHTFNVRAVNDIDSGKVASIRQTAWPAGGGNKNIVVNGDFENPDVSMWTANDTAVNTRIEDPLNPGNYVMRASGRTTTGSGPAQLQTSLLTPMVKGQTYTVSAKVYYGEHVSPDTGTAHANRQFYLNIKGGGSYSSEYNPIRNMVGVNAARNGWRTMTGTYTVPDDLLEPYVNIFVETAWASGPTQVANLFDFLVDDISIIAPVEDPPTDPMLPGAPTSVLATAGNGQAMLNWAPPANIDGSVITGYKVSMDGINWITLSDSARSHSFTGLNNGTRYTLSVRAVNSTGDGAIATADVTPAVEIGALYGYNGSNLNLAWQWNHNPDNRYWSLTERAGWMRLRTGYISPHILLAPNTLTQRTFGPNSSAYTYLDVSKMKNGDEAGITLFTAKYGSIGVKMENGTKTIVTTLANGWSQNTHGHAGDAGVVDGIPVPLTGNGVYLKAEANYVTNAASNPYGSNARGRFYYSLDGIEWIQLGDALRMTYSTGNHFMGYRFGLYNFAKAETGGYVDFDFYRLSDTLTEATTPTVLNGAMTGETDIDGVAGATANVTFMLDPLPLDSCTGISASFEIPRDLSVTNVTFGDNVIGNKSWKINSNQLILEVDGSNVNFNPGSSATFATISVQLNRKLPGDVTLSIVPDYVTVKGGNVVYNLDNVRGNIGFIGTGFDETSTGSGANPYLPLWEHVPDGETRIFEDPDNPGKYRAYLIGSHDQRNRPYCGPDIVMWSAPTEDLTNWRNEGPIYTFRHPTTGQWANMFAPDLVEVNRFAPEIESGQRPRTAQDERTIKEYYLYPHPNDIIGRGIVCKSTTGRPEGPYEAINLNAAGTGLLGGSVIGFDPSVLIDYVDDPTDPDYNIGFRAYGYWGWEMSTAAELNQSTMYSVRPLGPEENAKDYPGRGTQYDYFIPVSQSYGNIRENSQQNSSRWRIADPERAGEYNYFEAFAIRKVEVPGGNDKYLVIFSGYSGPDYGMGSTNSAMRYLYGDTPMGPWKMGGVIVDSRGPVPNQNGTALEGGTWGHNTHGGPWLINDQWYIAYHRPPRGSGGNRQAAVAPIKVDLSEAKAKVADGGKLTIRGYDPFAPDEIWTARGGTNEYTGAEVTSEGFNMFGLPPYKYYSAGIVCDARGGNANGSIQDSWDIWDNHMPLNGLTNGSRLGYKYFGFGGLDESKKGLPAFEGTKPGNNTKFNLWLTPRTTSAFTVEVWLNGPWDNSTWNGINMGSISVPAGSDQLPQQFQLDVSQYVDNLTEKNAIYLVVRGGSGALCDMLGLGFSRDGLDIERPVMPELDIQVNETSVTIPTEPIRSSSANGLMGYWRYAVNHTRPDGDVNITATSSDPDVKILVTQPSATSGLAGAGLVRFIKDDVTKLYRLFHTFGTEVDGEVDDADVEAIKLADSYVGNSLMIPGTGSETPEEKIEKARVKLDTLIGWIGVDYEITDEGDDVFSLKYSKGFTSMNVSPFSITVESSTDIPAVYGHSLTLDGTIGVNWYASLPEAYRNKNTKMIFTYKGQVKEVPFDEGAIQVTEEGETIYRFTYSVAAKEMTEEITAQLSNQENSFLAEEDIYTVEDYAKEMLTQSSYSQKAKKFANALLNYGGYAQTYFKYNLTDMANKNVTEELLEIDGDSLKAFEVKYGDPVANNAAEWYGSSLILESGTAIRHYVTIGNSTIAQNAYLKYDEEEEVKLTQHPTLKDIYYADIPNIAAPDLSKKYTAWICDSDENPVSKTKEYGGYTYAYNTLTKSSDSDLKNLVKAIYGYGEAAVDYLDSLR